MTKLKDQAQGAKTTELYFVLDRSGSMSSLANDAIGGFNSFVAEQQKVEGTANLTLVQFDNEYEIVHDSIDLKTVPVLTDEVYVPRGMTALYDAIGRTITTALAKKTDAIRILGIMTDGAENSSKEYTYESVKNLIKQAQEEHGWEILFLGANMDATQYAGNLGIRGKNIANVVASGAGINAAMKTMSFAASSYRGLVSGKGSLSAEQQQYLDAADSSNALDAVYANTAAAPQS
jgi:hypothetical protein